jgi:hypothetical protein
LLAKATTREQVLAGEPPGIVRCEEDGNGRNIIRLSKTA